MGDPDQKQTLILGINTKGEIILFDNECERVTGFKKDQILHKKLWDVLIPDSYLAQIQNIINSILKNEDIRDFSLPIKTFDEREIMVSWNGHPSTSDSQTHVQDICFIGTTSEPREHQTQVDQTTTDDIENIVENLIDVEPKKQTGVYNKLENIQTYSPSNEEPMGSNKKPETITYKQSKRRILFEKRLNDALVKTDQIAREPVISEVRIQQTMPIEIKHNNLPLNDIFKKYDFLIKKLLELEKKDLLLEQKNTLLEKNMRLLMLRLEKHEMIQKTSLKQQKVEPLNIKKEQKESTKQSYTFLQDPLGKKQRHDDCTHQQQLLDQRKKELDDKETHLINERKLLDQRIADMSTWKEKIITLEQEIEKRWEVLEEQERAFQEMKRTIEEPQPITAPAEPDDHHGVLDKIPQSAAIIQRGVLKQINGAFLELIGFEQDEIINRSLFDFIAPEGLADIEQYYLNRLQGNSASSYETVFTTKGDQKIFVEVSIKPTVHNGEKAEIAIINLVKTKDDETTIKEVSEEPQPQPTEEHQQIPFEEKPQENTK